MQVSATLGRYYRGKQSHQAGIVMAWVTLHRNCPSPWNNIGQTIPSPSVHWMEIRWVVRSTGCWWANCDAGSTALFGLCRDWEHPDMQPSSWLHAPHPPLAHGDAICRAPLRVPPRSGAHADAGGAGFPPLYHFEAFLPGLHLQVTAQSGMILLNWSSCPLLCWDSPS